MPAWLPNLRSLLPFLHHNLLDNTDTCPSKPKERKHNSPSLKGKNAKEFASFVRTGLGPFRIKSCQGPCRLYKSFLLFSMTWFEPVSCSCEVIIDLLIIFSRCWSCHMVMELHGDCKKNWKITDRSDSAVSGQRSNQFFNKRCWKHKWLNYWWLSAPIWRTIKYSANSLLWHKYLLP